MEESAPKVPPLAADAPGNSTLARSPSPVRPLSGEHGYAAKVRAGLALLRPRQWSKNGLVLLALVYSGRVNQPAALGRTLLTLIGFCCLSSAVYVMNDLSDRRADALHPRKRNRPLASGVLTPMAAVLLMLLCLAGAAFVGILTLPRIPTAADPYHSWGGAPLLLLLTEIAYLLLNVAYSKWLKHLVLYDVMSIASGFVLRALAGAVTIPVPISPWFFACTIFLALFLAVAKRRAELVALGVDAQFHRDILQQYPLVFLDQVLLLSATCTLVTYSLYTFQSVHVGHQLMLTLPLALFGMLRYLYLIYARHDGEQPEVILWRDPHIRGCVALYILAVVGILYLLPA